MKKTAPPKPRTASPLGSRPASPPRSPSRSPPSSPAAASARAPRSAAAASALDELDLKILEVYQRDTQQAAHAIGRAVGLSAAAVQRRLKRMRADKVIAAEVAVIAPAAVGMTLTCVVMVDLEREDRRSLLAFEKRICTYPEVQQCYYIAGQQDFVLVVLAADVAAYEAFTQRVLLADDNVRSFTTHVAMSRAKVGLGVPLDEARRRIGDE